MIVGVLTYDFDPPIGGLGVHVRRLLEGMERLRPDLEVVMLSPSKQSRPLMPLFARRFWKRKGGSPVFSFTLGFTLRRFIRRYGLTLLHAHAGSGGVFLLRRPPVPLVVTSHHTYVDEALVYKARPFVYARKILFSFLEKRTYRVAHLIICVSADTKKTLIDRYGIDPEKIRVIENAVPLDMYEGAEWDKEEHTLLFAGRIEPRKGIHVLLDAFARLHSSHPELRLRIVGENLLGGALHDMIRSHALEKYVDVLGPLSQDRFVREMRSATILAVPSLIEGFGMVAAEGMAAGTAVVASDCPGLRSVIAHGKTGLLFETGNADACADAIDDLLMHPEKRRALQAAARTDAWERFSIVRQTKKTVAYYEEM